MKVVGKYTDRFNEMLGVNLPCGNIYISTGVATHIQKRHPGYERYVPSIPAIISNPDYIGRNPSEPDSIELIKVFDENIQIAIKLDTKNKYLYVASLYNVKQSKVERRLSSGRYIKL